MTTQLSEPRNRYVQVVNSTSLNGIDFVELATVDATTLSVHFLNHVTVATPGITASISGGDSITGITVRAIDNATDWSTDAEGRPVLALFVNVPGDFSTYTLAIGGAPLDVMYERVGFSFKALCPSDFDCAPPPLSCPPDTTPIPAIDYTAKDFQSMKQALTDFSSLRYPAWQERAEADIGMMFLEALCATADELSYLQDRISAEGTLATATQRRSLVSLARLVDYEPVPALSATTTVQCNVASGTIAVPAGIAISATAPDGTVVPFEIGTGVADASSYAVSFAWNDGIQPYWFDDGQRCLPRGSTSMYVTGANFNFLAQPNLALLIQTDLPGQSIRELVHVTAATTGIDPLYPLPNGSTPFTQISWDAAEALIYDHDLTVTHLAGNLLPATQGRRYHETFAIGEPPPSAGTIPVAIARRGPNGTDAQPNWIFRYPLAQGRVAWLAPAGVTTIDPSLDRAAPEVIVTETQPVAQPWAWAGSLLEVGDTAAAFTIDPAAWRIVSSPAQSAPVEWEYDGDEGDTLRFGDDTFGVQPADGSVFDVVYRIGLGAAGNVAPDAIDSVDPAGSAYITSARNPFIVTSGADPETAQHIGRMAPQAFHAVQYRAVRPSDYVAAAETLPWVLAAGTSFRWTGSWLTVFTVADPSGNASATPAQQRALIDLLNRRRLAGYESYAPSPAFVALDVQITVCADSGWLASNVEAGVLAALGDVQRPDGSTGFFFANNFTFGTPLYRSALDAAIQAVPGVNGVLAIAYRRRGATTTFGPLPEILTLGADEILRVENDPDYPARGTIRVFVEGAQ